jgi:hypothetical protein
VPFLTVLNPLDKLLIFVLLFFQLCLLFFFSGFLWLFLLFFVSIPWFGHVLLLCRVLPDYHLAKPPEVALWPVTLLAKGPPPELSDITSLS